MKKYETLKNEMLKTLADEAKTEKLFAELKNTFTNESLIFKALTQTQLLQLLEYVQLEKALKNAKYTLIHDSNFAKSKAETIDTRVSSYIDNANKRVLHLYASKDCFDIVISSDKDTLAKLIIVEQLEASKDYKFKFKRNKDLSIKCTSIASVKYDNMIDAVKFALMILELSLDDLQAMLDAEKERV